jgi:hypothetical protein
MIYTTSNLDELLENDSNINPLDKINLSLDIQYIPKKNHNQSSLKKAIY